MVTKSIISTFLAITGKNVYDTIDNAEFISAVSKHPDVGVVLDVFLDAIEQTTISETIASNVSSYRPLVKQTLSSFDGDKVDFMTIVQNVMQNGKNSPSSSVIAPRTSTNVSSSSDDHALV